MNSMSSAIIFSNNSTYAYNFRTKVNGIGINAEYRSKICDLIDYILDNDEGIIFVDNKSVRLHNYLKKYSLVQDSKNFSFVFLTDNYTLNVDCDNVYTFRSCYDNIQETIEKIQYNIESRNNNIDNPSNACIEKYLLIINKEFGLSEKLTGTNYINECVKIFLTSKDKRYNILKEAYKIVAKHYKKNIENIEKSIRLAINNAINKNKESFFDVFHKDRITNSDFISYLVDSVKLMHLSISNNN
jgi:hypothetical protein